MPRLDRSALLSRLERLTFQKPPERLDDQFEQISLSPALRSLAELTHEAEYRLVRSIALHFLGRVPEPDPGQE